MTTQTHPLGGPDRPTPAPAPARAEGEELPVIADDMPVLYEDEGQDEMGESTPHTKAQEILRLGLAEHLRPQPNYYVFANLNVFYHPINRRAYVSPDVMAVESPQPLPEILSSYRIGRDGPAPVLVIEVLSRRSFQEQDLTNKPAIYARLGIPEYILVDTTGAFLSERLLLKRRLDEETWEDEQDPDGGITSRLGFRIIIEADGQLRVLNPRTGERYLRPDEAQRADRAARAEAEARRRAEEVARAEAEARRQAEERLRALEAELARLREQVRGGTEPGSEPGR